MGLFDKLGFKTSPSAAELILSRELVESRGAEANFDCVQAVVNYVNAAQGAALLRTEELPPMAVQVYEVDRYLAQVLNGGHGQYEHNCRRVFDIALPAVERGLVAMKAKPFLGIFRRFRKALEEHGIEQAMVEPDRYREILEPLDQAFFKADRETPLSGFSARMIKAARPRLVPDAELPVAYEAMAAANPFRQTRLEAAQVAALGVWFTSPEMVAAGMLLGTSDTPDMLEKILPGQIVLYNNQHVPAMRLKTATGLVHGVFMPELLTLHADATEAEQAAERQRRAKGAEAKPGVDWHHHYFAMQGIGRRHSMVMPEAVETTCALMEAKHVPLGIFDLLRGAGLDAPKRVGWIGTMAGMTVGEVSWLLEIDYSYYTIVMTHKGLTLYARGDDSPLGQVAYATLAKRRVDLED